MFKKRAQASASCNAESTGAFAHGGIHFYSLLGAAVKPGNASFAFGAVRIAKNKGAKVKHDVVLRLYCPKSVKSNTLTTKAPPQAKPKGKPKPKPTPAPANDAAGTSGDAQPKGDNGSGGGKAVRRKCPGKMLSTRG